MLCFSIVLWLRRFGKSAPKNGSCGGSLPKMSPKFAPRLRARTIWKSKSLKTGMFGRLFEVQAAKICTMPARESNLEAKIVKAPRVLDRFLKLKTLFARQARGFRHIAKGAGVCEGCKNVNAGVVDLKRVQ